METSKPQLNINRKNPDGKYFCTANHTNFIHPTHREPVKRTYEVVARRYHPKRKDDSTDDTTLTTQSSAALLTNLNESLDPLTNPPNDSTNTISHESTESSQQDLFSDSIPGDQPQEELADVTFYDDEKETEQPWTERTDLSQISYDPVFQEPPPGIPLGPQEHTASNDTRSPVQDSVENPLEVSFDESVIMEDQQSVSQDQSPRMNTLMTTPCLDERRTHEYMSQQINHSVAHHRRNIDTYTGEIVDNLRYQLRQGQEDLRQCKAELDEIRQKCANLTKQVTYWKDKVDNDITVGLPKTCGNRKNALQCVKFIDHFIRQRIANLSKSNEGIKILVTELTKFLLDETIKEGEVKKHAYEVFRHYVRTHVFTPFAILSKMDMAGGPLNYHCLEILRSVETNGVSYMRTLIPSSTAVQKVAALLEKYAQRLFPYRMIENKQDGAEGFAFRGPDVLVHMYRLGNVLTSDALSRPIGAAVTMDGAKFSNNLTHTTGGYKFTDISNPFKTQSSNSCWPVVCVCAQECSSLLQNGFAGMIQECREAGTTVLPNKFGTKKSNAALNFDLGGGGGGGGEWKLGERGGATGVVKCPCTKCAVTSKDIHMPTKLAELCPWCIQLGHTQKENWLCRHHPMCTQTQLNELQSTIDEYEKYMPKVMGQLEDLWKKCKLHLTEDPRMVPTQIQSVSLESIHFDINLESNANRRMAYSRNVTHDLKEREMDITGSLEMRQSRLRIQHIREWVYSRAAHSVKEFKKGTHSHSAVVMIMDTVPCILHMENRMGLKILTTCLRIGLANAKSNVLTWIKEHARPSEDRRCNSFVRAVAALVNTQVLGSKVLPTQWEIPYDKTKKEVATICMHNVRIRKVIQKLDLLIDVCIVDVDKRAT